MWLVVLAVGLFIAASVLPCCKEKEILYIFSGFSIGSVPINISLLYKNIDWVMGFLGEGSVPNYIMLLMILIMMTVVEEVVVLTVARMVWPDQKDWLKVIEEVEEEETKAVLESYYLGRYQISDGCDPAEVQVERPIEWLPVMAEEDELLLLSKECLAWDIYDETNCPWVESALKKNVVDELYEKCFTEEEKSVIKEQLEGMLFPLSKEEIERYFPTKEARRTVIEFCDNEEDKTVLTIEHFPYWLRPDDENMIVSTVSAVDPLGNIYEEIPDKAEIGVRLAMYVDAEKARELTAQNGYNKWHHLWNLEEY